MLKSLMKTHTRPARKVNPRISLESVSEIACFVDLAVSKETGRKVSDLDRDELFRLMLNWLRKMEVDVVEVEIEDAPVKCRLCGRGILGDTAERGVCGICAP